MSRRNAPYLLTLKIGDDGKGVPYGGNGEIRADGNANHGFRNLKQHPDLIDTVPELRGDPLFYELMRVINREESGLFTIGCGRWPVSEPQGFRFAGYVELAFNSIEWVEDASNYFPLFFHFDRFLADYHFDVPVQLEWELAGVQFIEADTAGYALTIWMNTSFVPTKEAALMDWERAIEPHIAYLGSILEAPGRKIYA